MKNILLTLAAVSSGIASSNAAITVAGEYANGAASFNSSVLNNDLIDKNETTATHTRTSGTVNTGWAIDGIYDGLAYNAASNRVGISYYSNAEVVDTFSLAGSATGYDITSITSITSWEGTNNQHAAQSYEILISTVDNPTYTTLLLPNTVDPNDTGAGSGYIAFNNMVWYDPGNYAINNADTSKVTITDTTGVLATGVLGIRFRITNQLGSTVFNEIDVVGVATVVPEPTTALLGGLGVLLLLRRRR
jgi:hypothetical protein